MAIPAQEPEQRPRPSQPAINEVIRRNIQNLVEHRRAFERRKGFQEATISWLSSFMGSLPFMYIHLGFVAVWIVINVGAVPGVHPFDPFPFVMLAMMASVEAIFLSVFVLISQNRMAVIADRRADLDLQISLLAEHEITRLIQLVDGIARHLGTQSQSDSYIEELKREVRPDAVLDELARAEEELFDSASVSERTSEAGENAGDESRKSKPADP